MTGQWLVLKTAAGEGLHVGTPVIFDIGVYLVVIGATLTIILSLAEGE
jgi:multicomponent Na+:H+ antiporter subunit B